MAARKTKAALRREKAQRRARRPKKLSTIDERHLWMLSLLRHYADKRGLSTLVSRTRVAPGVALGRWVDHRREDYRVGRLASWIEEALEKIDGWTWEPVDARQRKKLAALRDFVSTHGWERFAASRAGTVHKGVTIGRWVAQLRIRHTRGTVSEWLSRELEAIPGWSWRPYREWSRRSLELLGSYLSLRADGQALSVDDLIRLGKWVLNQRQAKRRGELPKDWVARVSRVPGWRWPS